MSYRPRSSPVIKEAITFFEIWVAKQQTHMASGQKQPPFVSDYTDTVRDTVSIN